VTGTCSDPNTSWPLLRDGHAFLAPLSTETDADRLMVDFLREGWLPWRYYKAEQDVLRRGALADRSSPFENTMRWTWSAVALRRYFWSDPRDHSRLDIDFPNSFASRTGPVPILMSGTSRLERALGEDDDDVWPRYIVDGASTIVKLSLIRVQYDRLVHGARRVGLLPPAPVQPVSAVSEVEKPQPATEMPEATKPPAVATGLRTEDPEDWFKAAKRRHPPIKGRGGKSARATSILKEMETAPVRKVWKRSTIERRLRDKDQDQDWRTR
jgi:hypothetical protein